MNKSKIQRSPLSPRLRPPRTPQIQSKIDRVTGTFLSLAGRNLSTLINIPSYQINTNAASTLSPIQSPGGLMNSPSRTNVSASNLLFLDLQDNKLSAASLKPINPSITTLNLTNNPLLSCSFPTFKNLRILSIDNCGLVNFEGFPFLPELCYLSAANNKLESFKGLHVFPEMESINLSGNPIHFSPKLIIAAVGSLNLREINRNEVTIDQVRAGFELSPLVGYALRRGRNAKEAGSPDDEVRISQDFLTQNLQDYLHQTNRNTDNISLKLKIEPHKDGHALILPFKSKTVQWYKSHAPNEKGKEWKKISPPKNLSILPITMNVRLHLVKCEFTLEDQTFTVYSDDLIGRESKDLALPVPMDPVIAGTPIEGSLISILPLPFNARIAWVRDDETITENADSILLTNKDIGKSIACLMQPYSPLDDKLVFGTIFTASETVAALKPIVTGITFPESILEGQKLTFTRVMNPDREGDSQITIERAASQYGEWLLVSELSKDNMSYTPTCFDVDKYLRVTYTPITVEGTTGETVYFYSKCRVLPTMPRFSNAMIGGVAKTFFPLVALADYTGGIKGKCTYDWYFSKRPIDVRNGPSKRLQKVAHDTQYFTPDANMADGYLAVLMVPVRIDEVVGDPKFVTTESPILLDDAPKPLDGCPTEAFVGRTLKFPTTVEIYLSKTTGYCGFDLLKSGMTYTPREKHVGRIIRVVTENNDVIIGEIQPATPVVLDVSMAVDKWCPGELVSLSIKHKHLLPDKVEIVWIRCTPEFEIPVAMDNPEYIIQAKDIGFKLKAAVTPMDHTGKRLETKYSGLSPIVKDNSIISPKIIGDLVEDQELCVDFKEELASITWYRVEGTKLIEIGHHNSYTLTLKEVRSLIKVKIVVAGSGITLTAVSDDVVRPAPPNVEITIGDQIIEDQVIVPKVTYHGGYEGQSEIRWYRESIDPNDINVGFEYNKDVKGLNYPTSIMDVDHKLQLVYTPIRSDGERGDDVVIECGPVMPLPPSVSDVKIFQNEFGDVEVTGRYKGGFEGQSFIIWRLYEDGNDTPINLGKTVERTMSPTEQIVGKTMDAIFVPVRDDGAGGQPVVTSNKIVPQPLPTVLSAEILVKGGQMLPGALMRCRATFPKGQTGQYQWHRGDGTNWEIIENATDVEFVPTEEEIGFLLLCAVVATNSKGWKSPPFATVTTTHIRKAKTELKVVEPLTEEGKLVTGSLLSSNLDLQSLSSAKIKWQKLIDGNWKTVIHDDTYLLSENDVGYQFRCVTKSGKVSEPSRVVELEPKIASYVRSIVKANQFKVKAKAKIGVVIWTITTEGNVITLSTKNGTQKSSKLNSVSIEAVPNTPDEMVIWLDRSSKFTLLPEITDDKRLESVIKKENVRDFVVAVIRGFIANSQK
ncbi:hypothetical protein M9Y10_035007 [Tritrichomonas musculus]|uniref:AIR9-like A9 domain-containing protein n=1 Tax=Tritrichomonas musculus TaxID=1915356 RepID=A0ABR2KGI1_9EUKA